MKKLWVLYVRIQINFPTECIKMNLRKEDMDAACNRVEIIL